MLRTLLNTQLLFPIVLYYFALLDVGALSSFDLHPYSRYDLVYDEFYRTMPNTVHEVGNLVKKICSTEY